MSEISLSKSSAMASPKLAAAKVRLLLTELNLHFAGVVLLSLVNIYLLVHLFFVWRETKSNGPDAQRDQQMQMHTAEIAVQPLRGIDAKVTHSTELADKFSSKRLPFADSQVVAELGKLAKQQGVRQTRVSYSYNPVMAGSRNQLEELRMDLSLSGDYRPLVRLVNALERDQLFFLIESVGLNGQQTGAVNLRLRLTTYLRPPVGNETTKAILEEPIAQGAPAATPRLPASVAPVRPMPATPGRPMPAAPGRLMPTAPGRLMPTAPGRLMPTAPRGPVSTAPMRNGRPGSDEMPAPDSRIIPGQRRRIPGQPMPGGTQR